jgi:hypothetical protein
MDAFHTVRVEIGPSTIQAESKFSQIGPSPRKDNPRIRLGIPWVSLSELSLFKNLRGPPSPEIISPPLSQFRSTELQWHNAPARARDAALLVGAGSSDAAPVVHHPHYSDDFEFCQIFRSFGRQFSAKTNNFDGAYSVTCWSGHCRLRFRTLPSWPGLLRPSTPRRRKYESGIGAPRCKRVEMQRFLASVANLRRLDAPNRVDGRGSPDQVRGRPWR